MNSHGKKDRLYLHSIRAILTRNFVLGFLAFFIFLAASRALLPALPVYLSGLGSNEKEIGLLVGILGLASLASRLFVGAVLAKRSQKSVIMIGALLSALVYLSYIFLRPFWPFLAMRFLEGIAFACVDTAILAFIVKVVPQAFRGQAIGYVLLAPPLAMAMSASSGVLIMQKFGSVVLFLACMGVSLGAFLFAFFLKGDKRGEKDGTMQKTNKCLFNVDILAPAGITFLTNFSIGGLFAFTPLYALTCGIDNPGPFFSAIAVMLIVGRTMGGRILSSYNKEITIPIFFVALIASLVVLLFARSLPAFIVSGALWGIGAAFVNPAAMAYALEYAHSSDGTAVGTYQALGDLGTSLGPPAMGVVVSVAGYKTTFLCLALICLLNIGYFRLIVRIRNRPDRSLQCF
jgi:predicted MFS family arabinose efflux permease